MNLLALLPLTPGLILSNLVLNREERKISLHLALNAEGVPCPACQQPSNHMHSRYQRRILDLPWADRTVSLSVQARKFRCRNRLCQRQIFCERVPSLVASWARRTLRLAADRRHLGLVVGGQGGARLSNRRAAPVSGSALLRLVRARPRPTSATPRVLGVVDWAFRKGRTYGAVLVDLERGHAVALLPDRKRETSWAWLEAHPGVQIVARDRVPAFADGVRLVTLCCLHDHWIRAEEVEPVLGSRPRFPIVWAFAEQPQRVFIFGRTR